MRQSVPDIRFINREIPISDVARALDLKFGANGNIHCWRPELHQNGDRTASVGILKLNNTVKCFGCGAGPFGSLDLVMSVLNLKPGESARWIAQRFTVPELPRRRHLAQPERRIFQFGTESEIGLLVHSGLWAKLSPTARAIQPVLLEMADRVPGSQIWTIQISYRSLGRFGGVASPNAVAAALRELREIRWLSVLPAGPEPGSGPVRETAKYLITPRSDELLDLAHANFKRMREEIEIEKAIRDEVRAMRKQRTLKYRTESQQLEGDVNPQV